MGVPGTLSPPRFRLEVPARDQARQGSRLRDQEGRPDGQSARRGGGGAVPGEEGKWFAAAKDAELFDEAIALANRTSCSPQTLTRAARDFEEKNPEFALEAGMAALRWLVEGYGYDVTSLDVLNAYAHTMKAAENVGRTDEAQRRIHDLVARETFDEHFVTKILSRQLWLT